MISRKKLARIVGMTVLPLLYGISLLISRDPDAITFVPLIGFPFWLILWVGFLFGGWVLAIIGTMIVLGLFGYLLGWLVDTVIAKAMRKTGSPNPQ